MDIEFDKYCYNPIYWHLKKYVEDDNIRYIYVYGGSSAGKTYTIAQLLTELVLTNGESVVVFRKESTTLWKTVFNDFKTICKKINKFIPVFGIKKRWIDRGENIIEFSGFDDAEKAKGLSGFKYIYPNEASKLLFDDLLELRTRMRGVKGQTMITDWNPISEMHFLKTEIIDKDEWFDLPTVVENSPYVSQLDSHSFVKANKKGNSILIKTTYRDNWWVVGHPNPEYGFVDNNTLDEFEWSRTFSEYRYLVYANGEWGVVKTGNEFWRMFDVNTHVKPVTYDKHTTVHVSIDNNVHPYIAVSLWQIYPDEKIIRQIDEIVCKDPDNTASRAGQKTLNRLLELKYEDVVITYGDYSTKNSNTIDDNKRSFYHIFEEQLKTKFDVRDRVTTNKSVSAIGEFVNALYSGWDGWRVEIGERCKTSISDYVDIKTDKNLNMLKKRFIDKQLGISYELNGHFSDTKKDFMVECLNNEFRAFQNKGQKFDSYEIGEVEQSGY